MSARAEHVVAADTEHLATADTEHVVAADATRKRTSTAQARAALWGGTLHAMHGDDGQALFVLTRWSLTRNFQGQDALAEVERFLDAAGAPA